ncbi:hypothetical protein NA56DRAFT_651507 [Hyaloscypha hepaticicola]|uniref:Uncharacterized protein n=1 Tax=Hyaloscypha hepaticicola TaxID=2082293 RepID=A0A2J6PI59_9HELO|nr:hypothetical protein NA56DRAFT_651507 [Hyaloscypha hepaticicola]
MSPYMSADRNTSLVLRIPSFTLIIAIMGFKVYAYLLILSLYGCHSYPLCGNTSIFPII